MIAGLPANCYTLLYFFYHILLTFDALNSLLDKAATANVLQLKVARRHAILNCDACAQFEVTRPIRSHIIISLLLMCYVLL